MQSLSRATIRNSPALTETASPLVSVVMVTMTAWTTRMRPVFIVNFVPEYFPLSPKSFSFTSWKGKLDFPFEYRSRCCVDPNVIVMVTKFWNNMCQNLIVINYRKVLFFRKSPNPARITENWRFGERVNVIKYFALNVLVKFWVHILSWVVQSVTCRSCAKDVSLAMRKQSNC